MKMELSHRAGKAFMVMLCIMNLCLLWIPVNATGDGDALAPGMQSYCNEPPFAAAGIGSNLLLMVDNSASMYDLAYTNPSTYCLDNNYQNGHSYSGYFDKKSIYKYDGTKFVPGATLPSPPCSSRSCAASTDYLYLEMAAAVPPATNRTISVFKASGNFLNWLSMSKLDMEKQALTGGKFVFDTNSTTHGVLQGETRGCQGKRFVKMIGDDAQITFAVRGPVSADPGYKTSHGGATTIEIYDKAYKREVCLNAVNAWNNKNKEVPIAQANACMDVKDKVKEITNLWVTDPSTTVNMSGTSGNVPGFLLDAGISNLGKASGTFNARVFLDAPPQGLIQEFGNSINFGVMVFNANGAAGSECDPGKLRCVNHCRLDTGIECSNDFDCSSGPCDAGSDGGMIISYINDPASPLGDHATGLIAAIDGVKANAWTPLAESFYTAIGYFANRIDLRLRDADFDTKTKPAPSKFSCQRNSVLIVSDGMSTADSNPVVEALASLYATPRQAETGKDSTNACPRSEGSRSLDDLAWIASHRNIRQFSTSKPISTDGPVTQDQSITTHVIFTGTSNGAPGECDPAVLMQHTAASGGGVYAGISDPGALYDKFRSVLSQIAEGTSAGADASIIARGNGNGAIFLQSQYSPKKSFDGGTTSASWIGEMQSLWYYIDSFIGGTGGAGSTVREDTDTDLKLILKNDRVVSSQDNYASLFFDANGDGDSDGVTQVVSSDAVKALWRAGTALWQRSAANRTIYTQTNGTSLTSFTSLNSDPRAIRLLQARDDSEAQQIISFVKGVDSPSYRNRTLTIPAGTIPGIEEATKVWKLGDIISSTPKVQSSTALNSYNLPAPGGYNDGSYLSFIGSNEYKSRGTVYVGANDGMLHAFNLGKLDTSASGDVKATLSPKVGETKADLGKESWAFIPKNALPYLTYLKEPSYQHIYYVDGGITLADVSIGDTNSGACVKETYWNCQKPAAGSVVTNGNSLDPAKNTWRTVVIGGMGLGGASCDAGSDCVPTPIADPSDTTRRLGYSSYFALDVTDPDHPSLLWEFTHPELGYSTTGPAIVRVGDSKLNGRWLAVFGSGPTGPIVNGQFQGHSNKELQFFVVDLRTGALVTTIPTGIPNAFAGSMAGGAIDDRWASLVQGKQQRREIYQDDAIYLGYVALDPVQKTWTRGGVGRIMIDEIQKPDQPTDDIVKTIWHWSRVIGYDPARAPDDTTGPVTTAIARLQDKKNKNLWLYFGSGRYYYRSTEVDDRTGDRSIYGIKEPCYINDGFGSYLDKHCSAPVCPGALTADCITDQSSTISPVAKGWRIGLDHADGSNGAERVITNPVSLTSGAVLFTTFQPSSVPCQVGNTYLWGVRYDTGAAIPEGSVQGKVLLQLSTGRRQETRLSGGFRDKGKRRSQAMTGSKPGGVKVVSNSGLKPLKKIIHIQER